MRLAGLNSQFTADDKSTGYFDYTRVNNNPFLQQSHIIITKNLT